MKRFAYWLAAKTGVGQELYDGGWQDGYRDCGADIEEAEAEPVLHVVTLEEIQPKIDKCIADNPKLWPDTKPTLEEGPLEFGYYMDEDSWSD